MELLATFGLTDKADALARNLPYGDQRRLEIARALATGPKILLLDEPAAGMNPQEKIELMELIRFIRDRFGVGILLIEHDMKLVMAICERITVLDHGETIALGTPAEVLRKSGRDRGVPWGTGELMWCRRSRWANLYSPFAAAP